MMRIWRVAALVLGVSGFAAQAQMSPEMQAKVDVAAAKILAETGVPSASLGVVVGGKVAYAKAYGLADVKAGVRADASMAYPIGSISKQFTATAVLLLQEQGKLSIDDAVAKYFPELTRAKDVKLRNLMTMTSGYEDFAPQDYSIPAWYQTRRPIDTVHEWATKPLDFEPGTEYQYSNTNYVLLALIVEKVTGEPYGKYLRRAVLEKAKLQGVFNAYDEREKLRVVGYQSFAMQPPRVMPLEAAGWYFGDGELAMPASTLLAWDITFMEKSMLSEKSYAAMETPFVFTGGPNAGKAGNYALALDVYVRHGHRMLEHSGEVGGYVAENIVFPEDKIAIVVLTNEVASDAAHNIAAAVMGVVLPEAAASTAPRDPAAAALPGILAGMAKGTIDRSLFTANCNAYFSDVALMDFAATLAPLGPVKDVRRTGTNERGGMRFGAFRVTFANGTALLMNTYTLPDGKIEQFLITGKG